MSFVDVVLPVLFSSLAEVFRVLFYLCVFYVASRVLVATVQDIIVAWHKSRLAMLLDLNRDIEKVESITHLKPVK